MMLRRYLPGLLTAILLTSASLAGEAPSVIRMVPALSAEVSDGVLVGNFSLANEGNERAGELDWRIEFAGVAQPWLTPRNILEPGEQITIERPLETPDPLDPGEYPLIVETRYRDAGGYPFSSITATVVTNNLPADAPPAPLSIRLYAPGDLRGQAAIRLVATSRHTQPLNLEVRVLLPVNLESGNAKLTLEVPAGASRSLAIPIANRDARRGSRLGVTTVITYNVGETPRCLIRSTAVSIPHHRGWLARHALAWVIMATGLLFAFAAVQWPAIGKHRFLPRHIPGTGIIIWAAILILLTSYTPPGLLMRDTLTVGGDTPAHNYLASHLGDLWSQEGRLLTWSHNWWAGFPAFQFYFPLPYALIAALSLWIPFNIAFKLVSVLGLILLPGSVYLAGRRLKYKPATVALMTVLVFPFLMTGAHVMWGVNIYSTLAGMIANSISFAIFPLALACAWRDANHGRPRAGTILLLTGLILSHFFTSLIAALTMIMMPLLVPRVKLRRAFTSLLADGGVAVLLSAWWLIPLFAKQRYSVDFGENWSVSLLGSFPIVSLPALLPVVWAVVVACRERNGAIGLWIWMTFLAIMLFLFGYAIHPVFINVRLWPFAFFGFLMLAAIGGGRILGRFRAPGLAVMAVFLLIGVWIDTRPSTARSWAEWNLEGLEAKPLAGVFRDLIAPLDGTPGRLAYDLNKANNAFGSSRIFEVVPHLIDKPILEGGLVNSALGALFVYTVQGGISEQSAGYPRRVPHSEFNPALGMRHLELFNARHLITAWAPLQSALDDSTDWQLAYQADIWKVFKNEAHAHSARRSGPAAGEGMIGVLDAMPDAVTVDDRQGAAIQWMQTPALLDRPMVWLRSGRTAPPGSRAIDQTAFETLLQQSGESIDPSELFAFRVEPVTIEEWSAHRIRFNTEAIGQPHLIKVNYFPNWQARGASGVYMVSPAFMLVIPNQPEVELIYGFTVADRLGHVATVIGMLALVVILILVHHSRRRNRREFSHT